MTEEREPHATLEVVDDYDVLQKRSPLTEREIELLELESRLNAKIDVSLRDNPNKHPKAVYFILPNEFGERFAFSSIIPNVNKYFMQFVGTDRYVAKMYTTTFAMLIFMFPLVGAALSDSYLGKWWTIIIFSIITLVGNAMLSVFSIPNLMGPMSAGVAFLPFVIVALGNGGMKPCVISHGGDQYLPSQVRAKDRFFVMFLVAADVGSIVALFVVPAIADMPCMGARTCYPYAFMLSAIVFFVALVIFIIGRRWYRIVPPVGEFLPWKATKAMVLACSRYFKSTPEERTAKGHWLNFAEDEYGGVFLDGCNDFILTIGKFLIPFSFSNMLLAQSYSEWATQYYQMNGALFGPGSKILAAQFSNVHRFFFIALAPLLSYVVYPFIERRGWDFSVKRRMIVGYFAFVLAFTISALLYRYVEEAFLLTGRNTTRLADYDGTYCEGCVNGWAQIPQWFLFSLAECLVMPSGLEFVYTESSRQFRAISTSFWMLGAALGPAWVNTFDPIMTRSGVGASERCLIFSGIGLVGAIFFSIIAWFHVPRKNRKSINQMAQEAKDAEFNQTCY